MKLFIKVKGFWPQTHTDEHRPRKIVLMLKALEALGVPPSPKALADREG